MIYYNNKKYICLLDFAMDFIRGKWKALLLCHLYDGPIRFLELQRIITSVLINFVIFRTLSFHSTHLNKLHIPNF